MNKRHRRSTNCTPPPLLKRQKKGPERDHLPSSGHIKGRRLGRSASRKGQVDWNIVISQHLSGAGEKSGLNFARITREQNELRAKVSHMVTCQQKQPRKRAREAEQNQDNQKKNLKQSEPYLRTRKYHREERYLPKLCLNNLTRNNKNTSSTKWTDKQIRNSSPKDATMR